MISDAQVLSPAKPVELSPLEAAAERLDGILADIEKLPAAQRDQAHALKEALDGFHRLGLHRMVERLKADPDGKRLLFSLIDEPEVRAILAMHGLIRADVATRIKAVLDRVKLYLDADHVTAELVSVSETAVKIQLYTQASSSSSCSSNIGQLQHELEELLHREIPEARFLEVLAPREAPQLVPVASLLNNPTFPEARWIAGPDVDALTEGTPRVAVVEGREVLFLKTQDHVLACENRCPHLDMPLDRAMLDSSACTLTCPWHGYRFDGATGECLTSPGLQLHTFPTRILEGRIQVKFI